MLRGVLVVEPGYTGGTVIDPTYEQVSTGETGHAEAIKFTYDPAVISYEDLLNVFFATHDPTSLNRQGNDVGTQYRSVIFYADETERKLAEKYISKLESEHPGGKPIVTTLEKLNKFYPAENYHKDYFENHSDEPYCQIVITPKVEKAKKRFAELLKT